MRFDVRRVDHLCFGRPSAASKFAEQIFPDAAARPTRKAIIDRGVRPVGFRTIRPAASTLQHVNNAADNAAIILSLDASHIRRQVPLDPLPLFVAQPK